VINGNQIAYIKTTNLKMKILEKIDNLKSKKQKMKTTAIIRKDKKNS
jgi:hypothetical protein